MEPQNPLGIVRRFLFGPDIAVKPHRVSSEFQADLTPPDSASTSVVTLRDGWDARPRYQSDEDDEGVFVGRKEMLDRLTSDFTSRRSGTILISGVRGVGKTALVEKALVDARKKLADRYWKSAAPTVENARFWHPAKSRAREVLYAAGRKLGKPPRDYLTMKDAATALYQKRAWRWFWQRFNPVTRHLRRMHEASRSQLLVLKFNASDIGGAMADPSEKATSGKPNVNPEKLLRALIRKIHAVCHQPWENYILTWSLNRKQRNRFFQTLQAAYDKSVSKSYTETISNKVSEAIKRSQVTTSELKINIEQVIGIVVCLGIGAGAYWLGIGRGWNPLWSFLAGGSATVVAYFTFTRTSKWVRESSSSRSRDAQFSYEYDYSLARMEYDVEEILSVLRQPKHLPFNPLRCFTRKVIIFDELDKLENPVQQLNDVITHFKNFFTLSDALFVFITDHEFYEHLSIEGTKAQLRRHYSPEHTFFTQKVYLRKPEFSHFKQTVFRFCDSKALQRRVETGPLDTDLLSFLVEKEPNAFNDTRKWPGLENLTHLYVHRDEYLGLDNEKLEATFHSSGGHSDPMALAQLLLANLVKHKLSDDSRKDMEKALKDAKGRSKPLALAHVWAATVAANLDGLEWRTAFKAADGWKDFEAVSFLNQKQSQFTGAEAKLISGYYNLLRRRNPKRHVSVDDAPFTLTDLAQAICFQTRNHYFDLYYLIYDYVGSYVDGLPVLHMEPERFTREHRLWSRYQQMIQLAFYYKREDHPSREYFNALLMESLYSVFDTRGWGGAVKVEEILFSPDKIAASLQHAAPTPPAPKNGSNNPPNEPSKATAGQPQEPPPPKTENKASSNGRAAPSTVTIRDAEQINQSLLRLLRIAVARKGVRVSPQFAALLTEAARLEDLSQFTFEWEPDCEPVITQEGLDLEPYEKGLIQLWEENKNEIEGLERELESIWRYVEIPATSIVRKVRGLFAELRTTVEGIRHRSRTISSHDAAKLRADLGAPDAWVSTVADLVVERLAVNSNDEIWDIAAIKKPSESGAPAAWRTRIEEIEKQIGIPPRCVVHAISSDMLAYFVAGSIPPEIDPKAIEQSLPKNDTYVFWYAPSHDADSAGQLADASNGVTTVRLYLSPPAPRTISQLLIDYHALATTERLKTFQSMAATTGYKGNLGLHAGLELLAPLSGLGDLIALLSLPDFQAALNAVDELPNLFSKTNPEAFWASYSVVMTEWSPDEAAKKIAAQIASNFKWRPAAHLQSALENMLRQGLKKEAAKLATSPVLTATEPHTNARHLLKEVVAAFVQTKLQEAKVSDPKFADLMRKDSSAWLVNTLEAIAKEKKLSLMDVVTSLPTFSGELEKARAAEALAPITS